MCGLPNPQYAQERREAFEEAPVEKRRCRYNEKRALPERQAGFSLGLSRVRIETLTTIRAGNGLSSHWLHVC
jgi:hypothetical protein